MNQNQNVVLVYNQIADQYNQKYFDFTPEDVPHIERFVKLLPPNAKVLDAGCGPGGGVKYLLNKGFSAEGIDISPKMIEIARRQVPEGKFSLMDISKLNFPDGMFDGAMANYSLIHIPSEELPRALKGIWRALKAGGLFLILTMKGLPDQIVDEPMAPGMKVFLNLFDLTRLKGLLEEGDFKIVHQEETKVVGIDGSVTEGISIIAQKSF